MEDLYWGLTLMTVLSALVFLLALQVTKAAPRFVCDLMAIAAILAMVLYIRDMWDNMSLERLLPYSNLIVIGNWLPLGVSFIAGLAWRRIPGRIWRKSLSAVSLFVVGAYALCHPLLGAPPHCTDVWTDGVSRQSTDATCSAAAAATLLRAHDIPATEREMAELCLTRRQGTNWQGLYRGLKLKTAGTPWDVEVFHCNLRELQATLSGPAILTVQLGPNQTDQRYIDDFGWIPGLSHSAVLFRFSPDGLLVEMGDPSVGREEWSTDDLRILWTGKGMRLVRRTASM